MKRKGKNIHRKIDREYDETKKMLESLRKRRKNISEQDPATSGEYTEEEPTDRMSVVDDEEEEGEGTQEENEEDVIELSDEEMRSERDSFTENVDSRVDFDTFKIYPKSDNAVFAGVIKGLDLKWQFSLDERDGLYVSVDNLKLDDKAYEILGNLRGHYENWVEEWSEKVRDEYKSEDGEDNEDTFGGV